jgi:hypothetical protein
MAEQASSPSLLVFPINDTKWESGRLWKRRAKGFGVKRFGFITVAVIILFSPSKSSADELEQGIRYSCSSTEVKLESVWKDGGGQNNPFKESDTEGSALWNIDRLHRELPILKVCMVGKHKVTAVIFKQCVAGNGIGTSAAMYIDKEVSVGQLGAAAADGSHPFIEAQIFGSACASSSDEFFNEIVVRLAKPGEKDAPAGDTPLIVQMK